MASSYDSKLEEFEGVDFPQGPNNNLILVQQQSEYKPTLTRPTTIDNNKNDNPNIQALTNPHPSLPRPLSRPTHISYSYDLPRNPTFSTGGQQFTNNLREQQLAQNRH